MGQNTVMPTLLRIDSSADPASRSRAVTEAFTAAWRERGEEFSVVERDVAVAPPPAIPDALLHWPPAMRPAEAELPAELVALQEELLDELFAADVLLLGAPLYNYTVPASLKAWIDFVHVPGRSAGPDTRPLAGRPVVAVVARGGGYDPGTATEGWDHATPVLELVFGQSMGMDFTALTPSYTLADTLDVLAPLRDRAAAELTEAIASARALAQSVPHPREP